MQKEASTRSLHPGVWNILALGDPRQTARAGLSADSRQQVQSVCVCVRKQDYYVFGNLEFDAETALLNAFMFKQISRSCCKIQGGRLTSKCKLSFNKRSPKSGWQGQTPLRPFIVYSFHLHNRELGRVDLLSYSSE